MLQILNEKKKEKRVLATYTNIKASCKFSHKSRLTRATDVHRQVSSKDLEEASSKEIEELNIG